MNKPTCTVCGAVVNVWQACARTDGRWDCRDCCPQCKPSPGDTRAEAASNRPGFMLSRAGSAALIALPAIAGIILARSF